MAQEEANKQVQKVLQNEEQRQTIHQFFSAGCFNKTWEYLDKEELNEEETENMIVCANASLYHWKKRNDCTPQNLSIAYWQLARVYTKANKSKDAEKYLDKGYKELDKVDNKDNKKYLKSDLDNIKNKLTE